MNSESPTNSKTSIWSAHDYDSRVSDLTLLIESCEFRVHKDVLQRSCDYFRAMFSSQMVETTKEVITLKSFMAEPCKVLFEGCYTGTLPLTEANIFSVTETAHMFNTYTLLFCQCTQYLTNLINLNMVFDIMHFSESLCLNDVYSSARKFCLGHFMEMSCSSSFLGLSVPELCDYLSDKYLAVEEEVHVVRAVSSWLEHNESDKLTRSMVQQIVNACIYKKHDCGGSKAIIGHLMELIPLLFLNEIFQCYLTERTKPKDMFFFWSQFEPSHHDGLVDIIKVSPTTWEGVKFDQMTDVEQRPGYDMGSAIYCLSGLYVFLSGGGSKFGSVLWIKNIWCFDFSAPPPRWKVVGDLKETRRHHAMVAVGGRLYLFGGFGKFRCKNTKLECFDLVTGRTWENLPEMPTHEVNPVTAVHQHNIFYIERQWNILCFDSHVKQWKQFELNFSIPRNYLPVSLHIDPRTPDTFLAVFREWTKFSLKSLHLNTASGITCVGPGASSGITCVDLGAW
ncbi:unnamed protein product, partial [Lymnaea stagnalis]